MERKKLMVLFIAGGLVAIFVLASRPVIEAISLKEIDTAGNVDSSRTVYTVRRWGTPGVRHGEFRSYWPRSDVLYSKGQFKGGHIDGLWTFWNENGRVIKQARYVAGTGAAPSPFYFPEPVEERLAPPWWDDARDQILAGAPDATATPRDGEIDNAIKN